MRKIFLLCVAMVLSLCVFAISAAEDEIVIGEVETETAVVNVGLSNDAAIEGFINQAFGIGPGGLASGEDLIPKGANDTLGSRLTGAEKKVYDFLKQEIDKLVAGERSSTVFSIPYADLFDKLSYTAEELGVDELLELGEDGYYHFTNEASTAFIKKFAIDGSSIIAALLVDCPYELYWFDKTAGYTWSSGPRYTSDGESIYVAEGAAFSVTMRVAKEYSASRTEKTTEYDTSVTERILTAAANAKQVVANHRGLSDQGKLRAYLTDICDMVSYNHDAADDDSTAYGNPWQLVWVFDGDDSTNVVCEGYSKAFKYLCDMSSFGSDIYTSIVTGTMAGGTGAGAHMWNLVRLGDGLRYLVDVTNCDSGSVGYPDQLFMVGYTTNPNSSTYTFATKSQEMKYVYDERTLGLYAAEELEVVPAGTTDGRLEAPEFSNVVLLNDGRVGGGITADVSFPEGAAMVYVEFFRMDEEGEIADYGSWFELDKAGGISILGIEMTEAGTYQLQAQAMKRNDWEEDPADSAVTVLEFEVTEGTLPSLPDFDFPETSEYKSNVSYTIPGAEAVTSQITGEWGDNNPTSATSGSTGTIYFQEVGELDVLFWGCIDGVWSKPVTKHVYVTPLGTLKPVITWNSLEIGDDLQVSVSDALVFQVEVAGARRVFYEVYGVAEGLEKGFLYNDVIWQQLGKDSEDDESLTVNLSSLIDAEGEYLIWIYGIQDGWQTEYKDIFVHVSAGGLYTVVDGTIISYHGDETVTSLTIPVIYDDEMITAIGSGVFTGLKELTAVTIPGSIRGIEEDSFDPRVTIIAGCDTPAAFWAENHNWKRDIQHDWGEVQYEWAEDNSSVTATRVCKTVSVHTETETVDATSEMTKAPTCEDEGITTYTSGEFENEAFSVQTKMMDIAALGHDWGEVTYTWAEDNSTVTATRVCQNDESHVETETVEVTVEIVKAPTCEERGETVYTSKDFANNAFKAQTKTETMETTDHVWGETTYKWNDDYRMITATRVCIYNEDHIETEELGDVTVELITPPDEKTEGSYRIVTGPFENEAFEAQTKIRTIPALSNMNVLHLPEGLKEVEDEAFCGIDAEAVIIPKDCKTIGEGAFVNCFNLIYVRLPFDATVDATAFLNSDFEPVIDARDYSE